MTVDDAIAPARRTSCRKHDVCKQCPHGNRFALSSTERHIEQLSTVSTRELEEFIDLSQKLERAFT
jgi:hypothetical protein